MQANSGTSTGSNELCQVVVTPSTTHALRGVVNKLQVLFNVVTGHPEGEVERPPLNLAIVLDRSGSMDSDKKLHNARLAIKKVIEALGTNDILHFVLYGSSVRIEFENANVADKEDLCAKVDRVVSQGCTNLHEGVRVGADLVAKYTKKGYHNRIFLFSDGLVNEGITDKNEIYQFISRDIKNKHDINVSAFGLGSDFDEVLMKGIAEYGCGAYFFIEGSSAISHFVDFALRGLFKLVGTDATLMIKGANAGLVTKIYSHPELTKPYRLDDLKHDDARGVVCELQVTPSAHPGDEVLSWQLTYRPSANADQVLTEEAVTLGGKLRINFTDDEQEVAKGENPQVLAKVAIQQSGEIDAEVIQLIERGKTKEAIAATEAEIEILRKAVDKDVDGSAKVAGHLKQVETALADLQREGASKVNLKKAHLRGYMKRRTSACYDAVYLEQALNEEASPPQSPSGSPPSSPPMPRNRNNLRYS